MNTKTNEWSRRYQEALRKHLKQGQGASLRLAHGLGGEAVALGLETLDVTRIHEQALTSVLSQRDLSGTRKSKTRRARKFFAEASVRIEKTHRAMMEADALIRQLNRTLNQRIRESSTSNRLLKQTILRRLKAEKALKNSETRHAGLLAASNRLLKHLRNIIQESMSSQENHRQRVSRELHDEIAQGLLGIHVRLLTLQKAVKASQKAIKASRKSFRKEIGTTQQLVRESARKVKRFDYEFGF